MTPLPLLAILLWTSARADATEVYIGLSGSSQTPQWTLALPPFAAERVGRPEDARIAAQLREVVRADLMFSRYFKVLDAPPGVPLAEAAERVDDWKKAGAALLLRAKASDQSPKASVSVSLVDLAAGKPVLERTYRQDAAYWRSLAHKISDDIVEKIAGHPGIAGTRVAFVNDQTGNKELYVVDYDGDGLRRLTRDRSIDLLPRWSPDRSAILYTSYKDGNPDIFRFDLARGESRRFLDYQGLNIAGGFSPDGARLALTLSREKNPDIYIMTLADRSIKRLTHSIGADASPTFAPDGRQIAFVSDRNGNPEVHIEDTATGRVKRLTHFNWCDSPAWSPTGEWIIFAGRANPKDKMDIFLTDVTGGHIRQITHGEGTNEDPSWSPDGRFIAFTSTRNGRRELFVMDSDGSAPHPVADIPGDSFTPAWSP